MTAEPDRTLGGEGKYRVLLAIGDSEANALAQAKYAAALPNAAERVAVTLTHVLHGEELATTKELRSAQRVGAVAHAAEWLADQRVETEIRDVEYPYPPTKGIVALAEKIDADAVVLCGRKRGAIENVLFGSVIQAVLTATTRPVVVVDPTGA